MTGSYAFVLHLMGNIEKAREQMKIQIEMKEPTFYLSWFQHGVIFKEKEEESLNKSVDLVKSIHESKYRISAMELMKELDPKNIEYYDKFAIKLKQKFEVNESE